MSLKSAKLNIVQKILLVEEASILKRIDQILENEMIFGYTVQGKPLTKKEYNKRIAVAEKQLRYGETINQEDLERESDSW